MLPAGLPSAVPSLRPRWRVPAALALLVLALCLGLTWQLWRQASAQAASQQRAQFELRAREVTNQLALRISAYVQALRALQALYASSQEVTRREFSLFVQAYDIQSQVPGLTSVGFMPFLQRSQLDAQVQQVRAAGFPRFSVQPAGERSHYAPVTIIEPLNRDNRRAFGYDAWSEPVRRQALELARDSNQPVMSGALTLLQDSGKPRDPSFLIVLPVYRGAADLSTRALRSAAIVGWVYAPFRAREVLGSIDAELASGLEIELIHGVPSSLTALRAATLRTDKPIGMGVQRWTLSIAALPGFGVAAGQEARTLAAIGVAGSVLLALMAGLLAWSSRKVSATGAAQGSLAAELEGARRQLGALGDSAGRAQALLRGVLDSAIDGILVDDGACRIVLSNQRLRELWSIPSDMNLEGDDRALSAHLAAQLMHPEPYLHSRAVQPDDASVQRDLLRLKDGRFVEQFTRLVVLDNERRARLWSFRDITERKQIEQRERSHRHVLELLARGAPLHAILEAVVLGIEATNPGMLCSILLLSNDGRHLAVAAAPSLPAFFNDAINGAEIGPNAGSCGAAAYNGRRVIVEDITTDPDWVAYREVAMRAGLAACWSQPIRGGSGRILGSFAIYHRSAHYPSAANVVLIEQAAQLASIALEQAQAAQALRAGEDRFRSLYDHAPVPLWQQDWSQLAAAVAGLRAGGVDDVGGWLRERPHEIRRLAALVQIGDVNAAALDHVGAAGKQLGLLSMAQVFDVTGEPHFVDALLALTGGAQVVACDSSFRRLDGSARQHALTLLVMPGHLEALDYVLVSTLDITERKRLDAELQQLASTDFLTCLPNRREFMARMDDQLARMQRDLGDHAAVLMLDIDHFKRVNDSHGHACGDAVLRHLADIIRFTQRKIDTPGRIGGEEFALLLPGADLEAAAAYAERLRQNVANSPCRWENVQLAITVSVGIAVIKREDGTSESALRRADEALYRAKSGGRNQVCRESAGA